MLRPSAKRYHHFNSILTKIDMIMMMTTTPPTSRRRHISICHIITYISSITIIKLSPSHYLSDCLYVCKSVCLSLSVCLPVFPSLLHHTHIHARTRTVSVSVSAQDGIVALGKAHMRSAPSLSSLPKVALETVPIFVWLNTDRSRPWRVECRPLPFSTPLSFRRSVL